MIDLDAEQVTRFRADGSHVPHWQSLPHGLVEGGHLLRQGEVSRSLGRGVPLDLVLSNKVSLSLHLGRCKLSKLNLSLCELLSVLQHGLLRSVPHRGHHTNDLMSAATHTGFTTRRTKQGGGNGQQASWGFVHCLSMQILQHLVQHFNLFLGVRLTLLIFCILLGHDGNCVEVGLHVLVVSAQQICLLCGQLSRQARSFGHFHAVHAGLLRKIRGLSTELLLGVLAPGRDAAVRLFGPRQISGHESGKLIHQRDRI
mmetsp:Transcript_7113/g.15295  ORF Transcript_7113/g.15295 Transcript_7113/m.15295 type:complete len:256 (-) Transcript_7113:140-907(-)